MEFNIKTMAIFIAVIFSCFIFSSCGGDSNIETGENASAKVSMPAYLNEERNSYDIEVDYNDSYFVSSATKFNKNLALASLGGCFSANLKTHIVNLFEDINFDNKEVSSIYDDGSTTHSIAFTIAHKKIGEKDLVAVAIRSMDYDLEWANNMMVGKSENHTGFDESATQVLNGLQSYIVANNYSDNLKLWITGYSRGGAVANILAQKILSQNTIQIDKNNMYVYTFEAPRGLTKENAVRYENVFNVINSADLFTYICPAEYGLYRCGIDIDIYSNDVDTLIQKFDNNFLIPKFKTDEEFYNNANEFLNYLLGEITKKQSEDRIKYDISTRELFEQNLQPTLVYIATLVFTLKSESLKSVIEKVKNSSMFEKLNLLSENGIYNFIKPIIESDGIEYDAEELALHTDILRNFLIGDDYSKLFWLINQKDNLLYGIYMHLPVATYTLLIEK